MTTTFSMKKIFLTRKEIAAWIQRNPRFVSDMMKGGLSIPASENEVIEFLKKFPHPTRFRKSRL